MSLSASAPGALPQLGRGWRVPPALAAPLATAAGARQRDRGEGASQPGQLLALPLLQACGCRALCRRRRQRRRPRVVTCRSRGGEVVEALQTLVPPEQLVHHWWQPPKPPKPPSPWRLAPGLTPGGDQPQAIESLVRLLQDGHQTGDQETVYATLEGATGTGKTFVLSAVIAELQLPALWIAPNKALVGQVQKGVRGYLPDLASVEAFQSPFELYRPAYVVPAGDGTFQYKAGRAQVNKQAARHREWALASLKCRDTVVVASSSAIFHCSSQRSSEAELRQLEPGACELVLRRVEAELSEQLWALGRQGKLQERRTLRTLVLSDMDALRHTGWCRDFADKYAQHLPQGRHTLLDRFNAMHGREWLLVLDESHVLLPHLSAPSLGRESRKERLIESGFRLPSVRKGSRPLSLGEIWERAPRGVLFASATPAACELELSRHRVRMVQRPTHILDPVVSVQRLPPWEVWPHMLQELREKLGRGLQALVVCSSVVDAQVVTERIRQEGIATEVLHHEQKREAREQVLQSFRVGEAAVLVGVALLREGLDFPNVGLVLVRHADAGGFLRSESALTQIVGRAARNREGRVVFYAQKETSAMLKCVAATTQRRREQEEYNAKHGLEPGVLHWALPSPPCPLPLSPPADHSSPKPAVAAQPRPKRQLGRPPETPDTWVTRWEAQATVEQRIHQLALCGDGSQIAPEIPGVGRIAAAKLVAEFGRAQAALKAAKDGWLEGSEGSEGIGAVKADVLCEHKDEVDKSLERVRRARELSAPGERGLEDGGRPRASWAAEAMRIYGWL